MTTGITRGGTGHLFERKRPRPKAVGRLMLATSVPLDFAHTVAEKANASDIAEAQRQTDEFDHEMTPLSEILAAMPGRN